MPILMLLIVGVGIVLFRCKLGIKQLCPEGDGGAAAAPPTAPTTAAGQPTAQQISAASGFPAVTLTEGMQYIANQCVNDIDKNTFQQFSTNFVLNLEADVLERHKDALALIYNYNGMSLQPMQGRALAAYSQLVLTVAREHGIALNPPYEAMVRSNLFAGSPIVENTVTGHMAVVVS